MSPRLALVFISTLAGALGWSAAHAASLTVVPISIDVAEPGTTGVITLRNREARPLNAQVRVFRWTQVDGEDKLEPTEDVVPSPPIVTINPGADYLVRVQRTAPGAIAGEEAYRTVIDELPNPNRARNGSISIVLRYLVPTFFSSPDATRPNLTWSLVRHGDATLLTAVNSGERRVQIVDLKLATAKGRTLTIRKGLAGYVLSHSSYKWTAPAGIGPEAVVMAASDRGPIRAPVSH